jgi:hypothetical protein
VKPRRQTDEEYARSLGFSRSTLQRITYIRRVAEAPPGAVPAYIQRAAAEMLDLLKERTPREFNVREHYEMLRSSVQAHTKRHWRCAQCGTEMTDGTHRPHARYCSNACRQKAYRERT